MNTDKLKLCTGNRLHVGCGTKRIEGWINVDLKSTSQADIVCDVTKGLNFADVDVIYAEHFLEHLAMDEAIYFLSECHRILHRDGVLRLSTPNLDWVWETHYRLEGDDDERLAMAVAANRAFHGWGHKFLWNRAVLKRALIANGFTDIRWERYGRSKREFLRNLECHEAYPDSPDLPHVLVVEAIKGPRSDHHFDSFMSFIQENLLIHMNV